MAIEIISKNKAKLTVSTGGGKNRKRRTKTVTFTRKSELKQMYREFEDEVLHNPLKDITVHDLVESYIKGRRVLGIKETTIRGYNIAAKRLYERFERISAGELTSFQVQASVGDMAEDYSAKTIANTISLLSSAYDTAVRLGQLAENPCKRVVLPKRERPDIDIFTEEDMLKFLDVLELERLDYIVGYKLALFCGLRRSEILGLREEHINTLFKWVTIYETRHIVDGKEIIQTPKTKSSARTLAIPDIVMKDLLRLIQMHRESKYESSDYLIQDGFGMPINPSTFSDRIYKIERKHGLPSVSLHDLRHTFASMLNKAGIDIARISAELGHSNITTTLNVYTHVFGDASASSRGIASAIDEAYGSKESEKVEVDSNWTPDDEVKAV